MTSQEKAPSLRKRLLNRFWKPLVAAWLQKPRRIHYKGLRLLVMPGVFHPGFFFSSKILADFVLRQNLAGKRILDLGCGSGLVALCAAKKGAIVTATDISEAAVSCTRQNAAANQLDVEVLSSDLFDRLQGRYFDIIAVNPPSYKKEPRTAEERAWYAGTNYEYFQKFFSQLKIVYREGTAVYIILSEECELEDIVSIAYTNGFRLQPDSDYRRTGEKLTLYQVRSV